MLKQVLLVSGKKLNTAPALSVRPQIGAIWAAQGALRPLGKAETALPKGCGPYTCRARLHLGSRDYAHPGTSTVPSCVSESHLHLGL